jgi:hypothetical protein
MLRKQDIDHILRAAAAITNQSSFVLIGTGAVIATARHIPAFLMMTSEIDLYVEGDDSEIFSDLIDATIGQGSIFHRTFRYYGDGVGTQGNCAAGCEGSSRRCQSSRSEEAAPGRSVRL